MSVWCPLVVLQETLPWPQLKSFRVIHTSASGKKYLPLAFLLFFLQEVMHVKIIQWTGSVRSSSIATSNRSYIPVDHFRCTSVVWGPERSLSKLTLWEMYSIGVNRVIAMYIVHIRCKEYVRKYYVKVCTCILLYHNPHHYLFLIVVQSTLLFIWCALCYSYVFNVKCEWNI